MKHIILSLIMATTVACASNKTFTTEASWYGERYRGLPMANGKPFNPDKDNIIASWDYPFGTKLDLSRALFMKLIGNTEQGIAKVKVEVLK